MLIFYPGSDFPSRIPAFEDYLRSHGCEIQEKSNEYELVRFASAMGVGVIYTGKKGITCNVPFVADVVQLFMAGRPWLAGKALGTKRTPSAKRKQALLKRDGPLCFYCSKPMTTDMTEEHLVPASQQGSNRLDNIVLACFPCNQRASHKSLVEKIKLRDQIRSGI